MIVFAHPALERSRVNRRLLEAAKGVEDVLVHDLYEAYPDFLVDVSREQQLLSEHEIIVLQHPLLWYSTPALVKEWEDLVLEHGWAYGSSGAALMNKRLVSVITTGGAEESYRASLDDNRYSLRQLLAPLEQTARLCGMHYGPPFVVHGSLLLTEEEIAHHAATYARFLAGMRDGLVDWEKATQLQRINEELDLVVASKEVSHAS